MKVPIPDLLIKKLPKEIKMDFIEIDVKLKNGKIITGLVVRGNGYIVGYVDKSKKQDHFKSEDIIDLRGYFSLYSFIKRRLNIW